MKNMTGSTKISVMILGIIALSSLEIKAQIIEDSARIIAKNHYYKY